jgi:hypothetical protein
LNQENNMAAPAENTTPSWPSWLGAAIGAGAGLLGTDKQGPVTTNQSGVPSWLEGPYRDYLAQLQKQTSQPFSPYTGQGVADLTQPSLQGVERAQQRALQGAPDLNMARGMTQEVMGGKYLDNPYLNNNYTNAVIGDNASQMSRSFAEGSAAQNDAAFNRAGAYGGSGWANKQSSDAEGLSRQIGAMANQYQLGRTTLGAGDYRSGVGQILSAGQLAGNLSQDDWTGIDALGRAGNTLQNNQQAKNDFAYQQYIREQGWPIDMLKIYGSVLGGIGNTFGTSTQQGAPESPLGNALGGAGIGWELGTKLSPEIIKALEKLQGMPLPSPLDTGQFGGWNSGWQQGDAIDSGTGGGGPLWSGPWQQGDAIDSQGGGFWPSYDWEP